MKNVFFQSFAAISVLACLGLPNSAFADYCTTDNMSHSDEKCYLIPGSVSMDEKSLYVNINDVLYPVNRISVDDNGVYVRANEFSDSFLAICPDGHPNPPWNLVCAVCGKSIY